MTVEKLIQELRNSGWTVEGHHTYEWGSPDDRNTTLEVTINRDLEGEGFESHE